MLALLHKPWWRPEPLSPPEMRLLESVAEAHAASAGRSNCSTMAAQLAAAGSLSYPQALAAAVLTLGGKHAPIGKTMVMLQCPDPPVQALALLRQGEKVPGWGNSFHRGEPDPLWNGVETVLWREWPRRSAHLTAITATLHRAGKIVFPNPSAYTAAAALIVGMPREAALYLVVAARVERWTEMICGEIHGNSRSAE